MSGGVSWWGALNRVGDWSVVAGRLGRYFSV